MVRKSINKLKAIAVALLLANALPAQVISPFNKLGITDTVTDYSFIVSGHFHGSSKNASTFPAATLQGNIDALNAQKPAFLMSLGDLFIDVNADYMAHYQQSLFNKLTMPMFNVVGNHDIANGNLYEKVYGKEYGSFVNKSELFILLNTEVDDGSIKNDQLAFLKNALNDAAGANIKNVFIFSHRPVWAENNARYKSLFEGNTRTAFGKNNFEEEIRPLLVPLAKTKNVYWMSGSMAEGPASFFYDRDEANIIFMQTAIRDEVRDAALIVHVTGGKVTLSGLSFTGQQLEKIEDYNKEYWTKKLGPPPTFSYRMLPYLAKQMLLHYFFWTGFFAGILVLLAIVIIVRMIRKRKKKRNYN